MARFTLRELQSIARNPKKWNATTSQVKKINKYLSSKEAEERRKKWGRK